MDGPQPFRNTSHNKMRYQCDATVFFSHSHRTLTNILPSQVWSPDSRLHTIIYQINAQDIGGQLNYQPTSENYPNTDMVHKHRSLSNFQDVSLCEKFQNTELHRGPFHIFHTSIGFLSFYADGVLVHVLHF